TLTKDPKDTYDGSHYSRRVNEKVLAALLANREDVAIDWRGQDAATLIPVYRDKLAEIMATTSRADAGAARPAEKQPETNGASLTSYRLRGILHQFCRIGPADAQ